MISRTELCQMTSVVFQIIMNSDKHLHKSYVHKLLEPWLGTGLITANGESLTDKNSDECEVAECQDYSVLGYDDM
jgi:hypothetical protein